VPTLPDRPPVALVGGSYGFGDDLAYFSQVFRSYADQLPGGVVLVREDFPVEAHPGLPLVPALRFWTFVSTVTLPSGASYASERHVPKPRVARVLWRMRPRTVVVIEFTPTAMLTWLVGRLRGARTVLLVEGDPVFRVGRTGWFSRTVKGAVARRSHAVLTSNRGGADFCVEVLGVPRSRLVVGPYLTSAPEDVDPAPSFSESAGVHLLFLNSIDERKGLAEVLRALSEGPAADRPWHLDVVGSGQAETAIRKLVAELGVSERVTFHGRVSHADVGAHYARCHVVLCPSLGDYRSLAGFEAVNVGRPVLVSSRDGAAEELAEAMPTSVVVVDPLDVGAMRAAADRVTDPAWVVPALEAARSVPEAFSVTAVGRNIAAAVAVASS
jgi:glycosyltransferase involved in cell wall biosynthesis